MCATALRRWRLKAKAVEYLGGKCSRCGYNKCHAALDFHHKDPSTKEFSYAELAQSKGWETIRNELDKCEILCANCHREVEAENEVRVRPTPEQLKKMDLRPIKEWACFKCAYCDTVVEREAKQVRQTLKKGRDLCCSLSCAGKHQNKTGMAV